MESYSVRMNADNRSTKSIMTIVTVPENTDDALRADFEVFVRDLHTKTEQTRSENQMRQAFNSAKIENKAGLF